ncbi:MAG: hypothetical protein L0170_18740, partial [Acidobacteria bacterium]|nr:hypothetical protein [Acidobacteriota bacterium]
MGNPAPFIDRLRKGILRIDTDPPQGGDEEAVAPLRRSLERTIARLTSGNKIPAALFRYQFTGGKALLFQGIEALPLEPARLVPLLNAIQIELQPGEFLELDGILAAWLIRPEVNVTDTQLRLAQENIKGFKTGYDRDHAAAQSAESTKIRLRSRMTQLVAALQAAQTDANKEPTLAIPAG